MLDRIAREFRNRTPTEFLGWLLSLLLRRQSHVLYVLAVRDHVPEPALPPEVRSVEIDAHDFERLEPVRKRMVELNAENAAYLEDVRQGKAFGLALVAGDDVLHYAFVFVHNKTACLLGLPRGCALIGNAFTVPGHRGKGLQGCSARCRARIARSAGFDSVASETSPDNRASQRGLEKAGLKPAGRVDLLILLNCIVIRYRRPPGFRLLGLCP